MPHFFKTRTDRVASVILWTLLPNAMSDAGKERQQQQDTQLDAAALQDGLASQTSGSMPGEVPQALQLVGSRGPAHGPTVVEAVVQPSSLRNAIAGMGAGTTTPTPGVHVGIAAKAASSSASEDGHTKVIIKHMATEAQTEEQWVSGTWVGDHAVPSRGGDFVRTVLFVRHGQGHIGPLPKCAGNLTLGRVLTQPWSKCAGNSAVGSQSCVPPTSENAQCTCDVCVDCRSTTGPTCLSPPSSCFSSQ